MLACIVCARLEDICLVTYQQKKPNTTERELNLNGNVVALYVPVVVAISPETLSSFSETEESHGFDFGGADSCFDMRGGFYIDGGESAAEPCAKKRRTRR